ncbi:MAG TPA: glycerol-3-phosphate dehydrogenase [Gemmatimonadaceae bacterium]|nr:glycerol-3-phosphate dehydrogenase [Gemmatimonadaceae bacterium]
MTKGTARQERKTPPSPFPPRSAPFSPAGRAAAIAALGRMQVDILVVGGGITGAGIARDAALRGARVALLERDDFGAGTSGRSSRLIHGGLRYLEHGHLQLVFEASRERRTLAHIAPHLVRPLAFTWPLYAGSRVPRWKLRAGLFLYDALALFRNLGRHRMLDGEAVAAIEPELRQHSLTGGALYYDASTDDSRLTLANARGAAAAGALVANHVEVRELIVEGGVVRGAMAVDTRTGEPLRVRAGVVVNATGPWADQLLRLADPRRPAAVRGAKGVHVAVPRDRVGNRGAVTILSPIDGRVMFVLPAGALTIIGTTETPYDGPLDEVRATADDITYLLRSANAFFPAAHLTIADVVSAWAGVRPLVATAVNGSTASASREHVIDRSAPGLVTVSGGKLTTFREMAAQTVDVALRAIRDASPPPPTTHQVLLPGGDIPALDAEIAVARTEIGSPALAAHLVESYGSEWRAVWGLARAHPTLQTALVHGLPYIAAELRWAVEQEMAMTLADLLVRRLHVAFDTRDHALGIAPSVAAYVAPLLGWSAARVPVEVARYEAEVARIFGIEEPAAVPAGPDGVTA